MAPKITQKFENYSIENFIFFIFIRFLYHISFYLEPSLRAVQKWSLRALLDNHKGGQYRNFTADIMEVIWPMYKMTYEMRIPIWGGLFH